MEQILHIITEMAPYLLLGFLFAGLMHVFVPARFYTNYLADNSFRSVFYATLLGIPLPLCSCGVLPTALSLHKEGGSKGATTAFLIATPQTGVDSILATYSLMGLPMAVIRPIAALLTALFGGQMTNRMESGEKKEDREEETPNASMTEHRHEEHCCCCHEEEKHEEHCCCHEEEKHEEHCCCHEEEKHEEESCCCGHHHTQDSSRTSSSFKQRFVAAFRYAFVDMVDDIGSWLVAGLVVAALITVFVPNDFFAIFAGNTWLSMLIVLLISVPMYICATGSIPIAVALMLKGLSPGTAFVMLMAGPACNIASILLIRRQLGTRTLITYLGSIIIGAVATGIIIDQLLPAQWFAVSQDVACCHEGSASWLETACAIILILLLICSYMRKLAGKKKHCCCK